MNRGFGPWITSEGCLESLDKRSERNIVDILESKWSEFTVAPHLKTTKPSVRVLDEETVKRLLSRGAGRWLWGILVKTPHWMVKCTS